MHVLVDPFKELTAVDYGDAPIDFMSTERSMQAIRDFVAHAWRHREGPAPRFVLLVGDGHYDPKDNLARGETVWLPPYLANVDPWMGETAADNQHRVAHVPASDGTVPA